MYFYFLHFRMIDSSTVNIEINKNITEAIISITISFIVLIIISYCLVKTWNHRDSSRDVNEYRYIERDHSSEME